MKLSVSMIVKNEESCLGAALESVKGADEIIIVDTGSDDNTINIAKKYTDKIYTGEEYKWRDDFAFSRNQSLDKCTGDWILIIDADEKLEDNGIQKIRKLISIVKSDAIYFKTISMNNKNTVHNSIRLFKNNKIIKWNGRIHNHLSTSDGHYSDIKMRYGYSAAHQKDPDRALRILSAVVKERPDCKREKYYLAREYWYRKDYKLAIYYYNYYLENANYGPEIADAYVMLSRCHWALKEYDEAKNMCLQAIGLNANFKEAWQILAELSGPKNKVKFNMIAETANNEDVLFIRSGVDHKKREWKSEDYDKIYKNGYDMSRYKEIQKEVGNIVGNKSVLDIGCGTGDLVKYVKNYRGFDFSPEAIKMANNKNVWLGNIYNVKNYKKAKYYVITEVLEHVDDLRVFNNIASGQKIIFSVPSFSDPAHIMVFTEKILRQRYGNILHIKRIVRFNLHDKKWKRGTDTKIYILLCEATKK